MAEDSRNRRTKAEMEVLLETVEVDFVQGKSKLPKMAEKYNVSKSSLYAYAEKRGWNQKRIEFQKKIKTKSSVKHVDRKGHYYDQLEVFGNVMLNRYSKELRKKTEDKNYQDTMGQIEIDIGVVNSLHGLAARIYGPREEPPPAVQNYEVLIVNQAISARPTTELPEHFDVLRGDDIIIEPAEPDSVQADYEVIVEEKGDQDGGNKFTES